MDQKPVVIMEDELVHTDEHPYCDDESCPCHEDEEDDEDWQAEATSNYYHDLGLHRGR